MIKTIENQRDEIFNPRDGPHSITTKNSYENTPNAPKRSLPKEVQLFEAKNPLDNDLNHFYKTPLDDNDIDNNYGHNKIIIENINSSQTIDRKSVV